MSLRNALQRSMITATRRYASTAAPKNPLLPKHYDYSFKQAWLSDPSTYPLMAILATASAFVVGMSANAMRYKNVKITPEQKHSIIPTYESAYKPNVQVTEVITRHPIGMYAEGYRSLRGEGLGIDHEEWQRTHDESKK